MGIFRTSSKQETLLSKQETLLSAFDKNIRASNSSPKGQQPIRQILDALPAVSKINVAKAFRGAQEAIEYSRYDTRNLTAEAVRALQDSVKTAYPAETLDFMFWHLGRDSKVIAKNDILRDMIPIIESIAAENAIKAMEKAEDALHRADIGTSTEETLHALWQRFFATSAQAAPDTAWRSACRLMLSAQRGSPRARVAYAAISGLMGGAVPASPAQGAEARAPQKPGESILREFDGHPAPGWSS